jgi:hypothetical protein
MVVCWVTSYSRRNQVRTYYCVEDPATPLPFRFIAWAVGGEILFNFYFIHILPLLLHFLIRPSSLIPIRIDLELWILQTVGRIRVIAMSQSRYTHRTTQTHNKRRHPYLECDSNPLFQCLSKRRFSCFGSRGHCDLQCSL